VKALHEAKAEFMAFLEPKVREMKKGDLIKQSEIQVWLDKIDKASFEYLNDAGIKFKKVPALRRQVEVEAVIIPELFYEVYKIESSNVATPTGRLLNGILQQQKLKDLQTIYDPFLFVWQPGVPGFYNPRGKELYFSFDAITYRMIGISDPIRHELNHALEDYKVHSGEPTLASFEFNQGKRKDHGYSNYLSLDEVESYLRDLRFLKFSASKQDKMTDDAVRLEAFKNMRKTSIQTNVKLIRMFISSAREVLSDLKTEDSIASSAAEGIVTMLFMSLNNSYYSGARIKLRPNENQKPKDALLQRIAWAENRLLEVESELHAFEQ
jgi:hypothetical protein